MNTIILWFRNDLRLHDHPALTAALENADTVVPLFIYNNELLNGRHGSPNRNRFLQECLADLRQSLRSTGADLIVRTGKPEEVLTDLCRQFGAKSVYYTIDYTPYARERDSRVQALLDEHDIKFTGYPGRLAVDSLQGILTGTGNVYKVFTPFWKQWSRVERRDVLPSPGKLLLPAGIEPGEMQDLYDAADERLSPEVMPGGETAGRQRLHDFLQDGIQSYGELHDSLSPTGTSRLSPYLHLGCVSVREIETMLPDGDGSARFHRQLAWRDFYHYVLLHFPENAHQEFQERYRHMDWNQDADALQAWKDGRTGYPIVDAAMRQLAREGWMHNRARLIVGSFLTKDLGLDWRLGEKHFMQMLLDGDQANNNGNWQWIASVGVDPAPVFRRLYNPMTQQERYDPDGAYVRNYVPELAKVPDDQLAAPWKMSTEQQQAAHCVIGEDYPEPIVDHAEARLLALEQYRQAASA